MKRPAGCELERKYWGAKTESSGSACGENAIPRSESIQGVPRRSLRCLGAKSAPIGYFALPLNWGNLP